MPWVDELSEPQELRRCIRDLVALLTLPAIWKNDNSRQIADSAAAALLSMLDADVVYVAAPGLGDKPAADVMRTSEAISVGSSGHIERILRGAWHGSREQISIIDNPLGKGTLRIAAAPMGFGGDDMIVAGSVNPRFPSERHRLLLGIAANLTTLAIQRWLGEAEQRRLVSALMAAIDSALKTSAKDRADDIAMAAALINTLSPRERQVLEALVAGQPNKVIAFRLGISVRTVEVHRSHMMDRLGVHQFAEAVRLLVLASFAERV